MPEPRQVEEGEVEDGELPLQLPTGPRNNGFNTHYQQSSNVFPNGAMKKPSIQIGLNKLSANRGSSHRPSLLEDDSSSGSTSNRVSSSGSGWNIKGAAVTANSTTEAPSSQPAASGINIKGRSDSSSNGDHRLHDSENNVASEASSKHSTQEAPPVRQQPITNQISIKGANMAGLPNKPAAMALPFKMKSAASRPFSNSPGPMSSSAHPYQSPMPYQAPSNAIGKGYGNSMLVPKMPPPSPAPVSGPSFTPPPRSSDNIPRPPSPSQRPPSPPPRRRSPTPPPPPLPPPTSSTLSRGPSLPFLPARPPTPQTWSDTLSKGKSKERLEPGPEPELEDGEEGEEFEEGEEPVKNDKDAGKALFINDKGTPNIKSSPNRGGRSVASNRTVERPRYDDDDDDRRRASYGRSQGDRWESSYRSPRRYDERDYGSSSRRTEGRDDDRRSRRRDDDRESPYRRRSGYDSYEDEDRHRSHRSRDAKDRDKYDDKYDDRDGKRHRDHDRDADYKHGRDRDYDRERYRDDRSHHSSSRHAPSRDKKGNVWRRGSSYSPNGEERRSSKREPDFHDEPGAPRHFDRELASTRKSLPSTPSLPAKPVAGLPERPGGSRRDAPPIIAPVPQAATPFFLPTPPPSAQELKPKSPWDDEEDATTEMDLGEGKSPAEVAKVEAKTFTLFGASPLDRYVLEEKLGEGTFGVVHKARRKEGSVAIMPPSEQDRRFRKAAKRNARHGKDRTEAGAVAASRVHEGDVVALKKIVMHNDMDGVPITALREIRILKTLSHPNVVPVVDMAFQSGDYLALRRGAIYMVFPYMAHDLAGLLENKKIVALDQALLKLYAKQLLLGTSYLHRNKILHRDMKAANLLLSNDGVLQIADFGLARSVETSTFKEGKRREYTNCVVTRWYRPPELLLGLRAYGPPIDMWGVGCVIGEMFFRHPIFTGSSDLDQISRIVQMCGPIDDETMPGWDKLPEAGVIQVQRVARNVRREFSRFSDDLSDLLDKLLVYNPDTRLTADQALDHDWFWTEPLPAEVGSVQAFPSSHEYDKRKAAEERQGQGGEKARAAQAAAFKGANHVVRAPAAPVQQPVHVQPPPPMPVMQANPWGNNHQQPHRQQNHMHHHAPMNMPPANLPLRPGAGLPPRPVTTQVPVPRGYPLAPMAAYNNGMAVMQPHAQPMGGFNHAANMQQHQEPFLPPPVRAPIAGRSNDPWGQADPAAKRPRLASPPGRLKIAGRSSMSNHADNLGGAGQSLPQHAGQRRGASAYDASVPAGSAEPLD